MNEEKKQIKTENKKKNYNYKERKTEKENKKEKEKEKENENGKEKIIKKRKNIEENNKKEKKKEKKNDDETTRKTARAVIEYLIEHPNTPKKKLTPIKCQIGKKFGYTNVIKDSIIMKYATEKEIIALSPLLRRRYTRTLSGVTIVAVMTKPYPCPGKCIYCPGPESQPGDKVAQSYTGREPAAMRSAMYHYDPYEQTFHRLLDLKAIGHNVDKIELIIMGGTFFYTPEQYQNEFVKGCFDAIINFGKENYNNHRRTKNLEEAKLQLETAPIRLIGVTFETRPDYCTPKYVDRMLYLGATRVEIGIQATDDKILNYVNRGHSVKDSIEAIRTAKDSGLKVNAHMMPNLPLSSPDHDLEMFRELFSNPNFRPDMLKIYPTLVVEGTQLYELYKKKLYKPYPEKETIRIIAQIKSELPPYVRIQRIQRDIPAQLIIDGVKSSNLRQLVQKHLKNAGKRCNCIRCREEGFYHYEKGNRGKHFDESGLKFLCYEYEASYGKEFFLSFENPEEHVLVGYLRLRFPSIKAHRRELQPTDQTAIVREIRVVGELVPHSDKPQPGQIQHRGYGKKLMKEAEKIANKHGKAKLLVIAGIGVRHYFYKLGFKPDGPYVSKKI